MRERTLCLLFFLFVMTALSSCEIGNREAAQGAAEVSGAPAATTIPPPTSTSTPIETQIETQIETPIETPMTMNTPTIPSSDSSDPISSPNPAISSLEKTLIDRYRDAKPKKWGENVPGVRTQLTTEEQVIALTFDACGGKEGSGYDKKLIDYLIKENIPATLFINARWITANMDIFSKLAANPLFEIENHGTEHRPLSVNGRLAYGIEGTKNVNDVIHEVKDNADQIEKLTGRRPLFFRSGTAYYDDIAAGVVQDLGFQLAGYNVLGDAGATYNTEQVYKALLKARSGSIVLAHMNRPEKDTAEGIMKAIPELQKAGYRFVLLTSSTLN
ncbi:polysaccharide deacetylase family protein [Paenibacillus sp. V4I7]|uniref:polysaccharide deacetylase family protein n=1 Tax=Paenibacillus sp. V4I7 TaxID=3042307 RepID=UPI00278B5653|nr:polysaccharide deacetylase family protein [Paenibacillus sp. V4I7]MDQ0903652.1 peptidoglycan/xylan/chitin deacetylase (PgdA/CDA1 family) [Paenibacillus sp. V4I7]